MICKKKRGWIKSNKKNKQDPFHIKQVTLKKYG